MRMLFWKRYSCAVGKPHALTYAYANTQAKDFLKLPENEGKDYDKPLRILLAGSCDLRDVIYTVASLDQIYTDTDEIPVLEFYSLDLNPMCYIRQYYILQVNLSVW